MYSALLRLPRNVPLAIKQKRVEDTINELGLTHVADAYIGVPGQRSLSGGEKRRVSIGKELVTSPSILFLDEPTSGLDAYNASVVMECLLRLARNSKRTIITTIHQVKLIISMMLGFSSKMPDFLNMNLIFTSSSRAQIFSKCLIRYCFWPTEILSTLDRPKLLRNISSASDILYLRITILLII
jgi:ABC-type enterochelin transport system ATPase subunit